MYCHKCGAQLEDGSKFCIKCGAKQIPEPQSGTKPAPGPQVKKTAGPDPQYAGETARLERKPLRTKILVSCLLHLGAALWAVPTFILELISGINTFTCIGQNTVGGMTAVQYYLQPIHYYGETVWINPTMEPFVMPTALAVISAIVFLAAAFFAILILLINLYAAMKKYNMYREMNRNATYVPVDDIPLNPQGFLVVNCISANFPGIAASIMDILMQKEIRRK